MNFTINKINDNGSVDVTYSDGKKQNISNMPVSDSDALTEALIAYGQAYESGKASEAITVEISTEVQAMAGTKVDVDAYLAEKERIEAEAALAVEPVVEVQEVAETPVVVVPENSPTVPEEMITPEMAEAGVTTETPLVTREEVVAQLGEEVVQDLEANAETVDVITEAPVEAVPAVDSAE